MSYLPGRSAGREWNQPRGEGGRGREREGKRELFFFKAVILSRWTMLQGMVLADLTIKDRK